MTRAVVILARVAAVLVVCAFPAFAAAAQYPTRPIRIIIPFPPGGGVDIVARTVAERMSARLNQPVVVDNRPGAGTTLGTELGAKATPDGYTLLIAPVAGAAIVQAYYPKLNYDLRRDFAPITKIGFGTVVFVVPPSLGVSSVKEVVVLAKTKPGQLTFASSGTGALIHLTGELFKQMAGINIVHVPYKGTSQLLPDLLDGRVSMTLDSMPAHLPHIKTGKLRALAVASRSRSAQLPDVPTMIELGYPGFVSHTDYALYGPARTPAEVVALLNRETNALLQIADVRAKLAPLGIEVSGSTPDALRAELNDELAKWAKVIRDANIKPE